MKRTLCLPAMMALAIGRPAWAQQDELARLKVELANQQAIIARLIKQVEELEKKQAQGVTREELEEEAKTQQESVGSVRETLLSRMNLNGHYDFRFSADNSPTPTALQQRNLGVLMGKQLGRFNFLMGVELQNVRHHPEISRESEGESYSDEWRPQLMSTEKEPPGRMSAAKARWPLTTPGWNTITIATSTSASGNCQQPVRSQQPGGSRGGKSRGGRLQLGFSTGELLKRFDVAADVCRGRIALMAQEPVDDRLVGFDSQVEFDRFLLNLEYARGRTLERTRFDHYVQPAVRLHEDWIGFDRV